MSFVAATPVLMADGATKPISKIEVGDRISAANPETGERGVRLRQIRLAQAVICGVAGRIQDLELDDHRSCEARKHLRPVVYPVDIGAGPPDRRIGR